MPTIFHGHAREQVHTPPIHNLSFDVLYTIFMICYNAPDFLETFSLTASHVCQRWRSLAIESTALWTTITFVHRKPRWEQYETWLARSKEAGLRLYLKNAFLVRSCMKRLSRFLRLILPHSTRWVSIAFYGVPTKALRVAFDRIRLEKLPQLESIELLWAEGHKQWKATPFAHGTPSLCRLTLKQTPFSYSSSLFDNLTDLTIEHSREGVIPTYQHAVSLLRSLLVRSPQMRNLTFDIQIVRFPETQAMTFPRPAVLPPPLVHQGLRHLRLHPSSEMIELFVGQVHTPNILSIGWPDIELRHMSLSTLAAFGQWSVHCNLRRVAFGTARDATGELEAQRSLAYIPLGLTILSALERLEFMTVDFAGPGKLACLGWLCPQLTELWLGECKGIMAEELIQVVTLRIASDGIEPFRKLTTSRMPGMMSNSSRAKMTAMGYRGVVTAFRDTFILHV